MASSHGNWAKEVRYYHGKGNAPRRSIHIPFFSVLVLGLSVLTVVALVVEIS